MNHNHHPEENLLDLTASFVYTSTPTSFGVYDADASFQAEADGMVRLVYSQLGGNVLEVEITNRDVYTSLEQAALEYSAIVNSYQAKSVLANIIGSPTGSLKGQENRNPRLDLSLAKRQADAYSSEAGVGGTRTLYSASIDLIPGTQKYNLNNILSSSGIINPQSQRAEIRDIFHFSNVSAYRFFDTTSAINYLHNEFQFESFTPETVFYLLPVWEDMLRASQMKQSFNIRRSNYSFNIVNNVLTLYPVPSVNARLFFTYYVNGDGAYDPNDVLYNGVSNLSNVPFGNIAYGGINSLGRQWIRRFALALSKEVLGHVRSKISSIPIPNGSLDLNGVSLISEAQMEKDMLRNELKEFLDVMTYDKLTQQETEQAENLKRTLLTVPMGIWVGVFCLFFISQTIY